ncbi:MAG: mechanosensitive ion channel, partial [Actinomycetota bacterium]|nr:mechanosensitive ion channel [Actinomycetota bacterium]
TTIITIAAAAARALRRIINPGDRVDVDGHAGLVVAIHSTATELEVADGSRLLLPNSTLLSESLTIERGEIPAD